MKQILAVIAFLVAFLHIGLEAQTTWSFDNGPWYALVDEMSAGLKEGQVILYAADSSETSLMKSTDRGETWTHILSLQGGYAVSVSAFPGNADVVYAAFRHSNPIQGGIYKSIDGGDSWTRLDHEWPNHVFSRVMIHPTDTSIVWVGCLQFPLGLPPVLYRSTDGGGSWQAFAEEQNFPRQLSVSDLAVSENTNYIWVSAYSNQEVNAGVWRTTNAGASWERRVDEIDTRNFNIASLALDPNNPNVLFAGNRYNPDADFVRKVYRTDDGTGECIWTEKYSAPGGRYNFTDLAVNPFDGNIVYVTTGVVEGPGVLQTLDGGDSWSYLTNGIRTYDLRAVVPDPLDGSLAYIAGYGSVYRSDDTGESWVQKNRGQLQARTIGVAVSSNTKYAAQGGIFARKLAGENTWTVLEYGTGERWIGGQIAVRPGGTDYVLTQGGAAVGFVDGPAIYLSTDSGDDWTQVYWFGSDYWNIISSLKFDPKVNYAVYATRMDQTAQTPPAVLKSQDGGEWSDILTSITSDVFKEIVIEVNTQVTPSDVLYVAGNHLPQLNPTEPFVLKSTDFGSSWFDVSSGLSDAEPVNVIAEDPARLDVLYVGTTQGLYRTTNGGAFWIAVGEEISEEALTAVLIHPVTSQIVYVGTQEGKVYKSTDMGEHWQEFSSGLAAAKVNRFDTYLSEPNLVYAATDAGVFFMRHVWTGEISANVTWHSGQTYLVEGTLTVPTGKTLTIEPGARVELLPGAGLQANGQLLADGSSGSHIVFTRNGTGVGWSGIVVESDASASLSYADIFHCATALRVKGDAASFSMSGCTVDDAAIGVEVVDGSGEPSGDTPFQVTNSTFQNITGTGIFVTDRSSMVIQDNTLTGSSGMYGIECISASPDVLNNRVEGFEVGLYCLTSSSPQLDVGDIEGHNVLTQNDYGVVSKISSPILGLLSGALDDEGGMNSIFNNTEFDVLLVNSVVIGENNWYGTDEPPFFRFYLDINSRMDWDPWLTYDPNEPEGRPVGGGKNDGKVFGAGSEMDPILDLFRQALIERGEGRYVQAAAMLKNIVTSSSAPLGARKWALRQLLAVAQRLRSYDLSSYIVNALANHPVLVRELRSVLPHAYLHKGLSTNAIAAFDVNIQQYPNSEIECAALYGKFLYALYRTEDTSQARQLLELLNNRYPESAEAYTAAVQLGNASGIEAPRPGNSLQTPEKAAAVQNQLAIPSEFKLAQNYPNPFNPSTQIKFDLPEAGSVSIVIYDVLGRKVTDLVAGQYQAGYHSATWNPSGVSSGVYIARLTVSDALGVLRFTRTSKLVLLK